MDSLFDLCEPPFVTSCSAPAQPVSTPNNPTPLVSFDPSIITHLESTLDTSVSDMAKKRNG